MHVPVLTAFVAPTQGIKVTCAHLGTLSVPKELPWRGLLMPREVSPGPGDHLSKH